MGKRTCYGIAIHVVDEVGDEEDEEDKVTISTLLHVKPFYF